ncbi:NUDIX domain-containing protein [Bacillus sp. EB600]|uniref:NUDIX hydrolase n=1 Tax=Bacillus sp. EB600 TaxID=2806345 RepID=UPI00210D52AF|nr:NUDIX domain-containing protein [Bacillus sp. EB600]MCQ6281663.1 NUDIX domain-containing protein [Bacillus sp. EB600]
MAVAISRPASTVVLMDDAFRVYMTKRPNTMKFMGGFYVFPGGKVAKGDYEVNQERLKTFNLDESFHYSYYIAAARELFEEVGILLVFEEDGKQLSTEKKKEYRRLLINEEITFAQMLQEENLHLDLTNLTYFGHIVTPEFNPVRFDTRFFMAKLPKSQIPKPHIGEIDHAAWIVPEDAVNGYNLELMIAPPTLHSLKAIFSFINGGELAMSAFNISDYLSPAQIEKMKKRANH